MGKKLLHKVNYLKLSADLRSLVTVGQCRVDDYQEDYYWISVCNNCHRLILSPGNRWRRSFSSEISKAVWYPYYPLGSDSMIEVEFCLSCNFLMKKDAIKAKLAGESVERIQMMYINGNGRKLFPVPLDDEEELDFGIFWEEHINFICGNTKKY